MSIDGRFSSVRDRSFVNEHTNSNNRKLRVLPTSSLLFPCDSFYFPATAFLIDISTGCNRYSLDSRVIYRRDETAI